MKISANRDLKVGRDYGNGARWKLFKKKRVSLGGFTNWDFGITSVHRKY
jgi:hypothetical protein